MTNNNNISADFPFTSKFINVNGANMHYIDEGQGDPIVFFHGVPTSAYLWRNIIPYLTDHARCIAFDLVGFGQSDKPNISYNLTEHMEYVTGFLDKMNLKNATYVLHAWGGIMGFHYAMNHQDNIKALAFLETHIRPTLDWDMLSLPVQELVSLVRNHENSKDAIINTNYFIENVFTAGLLRKLTDTEMQHYAEPFNSPKSRQAIWQYMMDLPIGDRQSPASDIITEYSEKLAHSDIPKLMLYAIPGFITTVDTIEWAKENLSNLSIVDIGDAFHYPQETNPGIIGDTLKRWYDEIDT